MTPTDINRLTAEIIGREIYESDLEIVLVYDERRIPIPWTPTTNIAQSMEVEAKMFELGYTLEMCRRKDGGFSVFVYEIKTRHLTSTQLLWHIILI